MLPDLLKRWHLMPTASETRNDLEKRSTTNCPSPVFTAVNGLEFNTECGRDLDPNSQRDAAIPRLGNSVELSMSDCMNICASSDPPGGTCIGVWFNSTDGACYQLAKGIYNATIVSSDVINIAKSRYSQWRPPVDVSCPFDDGSSQITKNGEEFEIFCDQDFEDYGDMCAYSLGEYMCHPHADSLPECLDYCSQAHPLCTGVSWNPDMHYGYDNCYLKSQPYAGVPTTTQRSHSARVPTQGYTAALEACPSNHTYHSDDGTVFQIDCFDPRYNAANYTSVHHSSIAGCMDDCSANPSQKCTGVLFNYDYGDGWDNCYLLDNNGVSGERANYTFAGLTSRPSSASASAGSKSSPSRAWIAGPVIGALVAVALLAGLFFWLGRRSRRKKSHMEKEGSVDLKHEPEVVHEAGGQEQSHMLPADHARHELRDPRTEALIQHELDT